MIQEAPVTSDDSIVAEFPEAILFFNYTSTLSVLHSFICWPDELQVRLLFWQILQLIIFSWQMEKLRQCFHFYTWNIWDYKQKLTVLEIVLGSYTRTPIVEKNQEKGCRAPRVPLLTGSVRSGGEKIFLKAVLCTKQTVTLEITINSMVLIIEFPVIPRANFPESLRNF